MSKIMVLLLFWGVYIVQLQRKATLDKFWEFTEQAINHKLIKSQVL